MCKLLKQNIKTKDIQNCNFDFIYKYSVRWLFVFLLSRGSISEWRFENCIQISGLFRCDSDCKSCSEFFGDLEFFWCFQSNCG